MNKKVSETHYAPSHESPCGTYWLSFSDDEDEGWFSHAVFGRNDDQDSKVKIYEGWLNENGIYSEKEVSRNVVSFFSPNMTPEAVFAYRIRWT